MIRGPHITQKTVIITGNGLVLELFVSLLLPLSGSPYE